MNQRPMLSDVGEKGLIRTVLADYATTARENQIDDCVVIELSERLGIPGLPNIVYSIDHPGLIDRPLPPNSTWRFRGRWAAACTCNDVIAMGAQPQGFALDLALPKDIAIDDVRDFYQGMTDVLTEYGVVIEGGNIDANDRFETAAMCWGTVSPEGMIRREGARAGDVVAVTTPIGLGWASHLLHRNGRFAELSPAIRAELEEYNLMPLGPAEAVRETVRMLPGEITSGMDLTDGLIEFLDTIRVRNGLGAVIDARSVPVPPALAECAALLGVPPQVLCLEYGFDTPRMHGYTVRAASWEKVSEIFARCGWPLYRIGEVTVEPRLSWRSLDGTVLDLPRLWWDPYGEADIVGRWTSDIVRALSEA